MIKKIAAESSASFGSCSAAAQRCAGCGVSGVGIGLLGARWRSGCRAHHGLCHRPHFRLSPESRVSVV